MRNICHLINDTLPALFGFLSVLSLVQVPLIAECAAKTPTQTQQAPAVQFIQSLGNNANGVLVDKSLTPAELDTKYREMMDNSFDIDAINEFVIGRSWQEASAEQQRTYLILFKELVLKTYGGHLHFLNGEGLHVSGVRSERGEDTVVSTEITHPNGIPATPVDWVVRHESGVKLAIVDVVVDGVSLNSTQHQEFASILDQNGGDFSVLLNTLRQKVRPDSSTE
jgi:phospholipid transport system substrate-binding protein